MTALADDLPGVQLVGVVAPLRAVAGRLPPCDVALVADPGAGGAPGLRQLVAGCGRPAVVLARSVEVDTYRRALGAGARAVLPLPAVPSALGDALVEATATAGHRRAPRRAGWWPSLRRRAARAPPRSPSPSHGSVRGCSSICRGRGRASPRSWAAGPSDRSPTSSTSATAWRRPSGPWPSRIPCGLRLVPGPAGPEIAAALPSGFAAGARARAAHGGAGRRRRGHGGVHGLARGRGRGRPHAGRGHARRVRGCGRTGARDRPGAGGREHRCVRRRRQPLEPALRALAAQHRAHRRRAGGRRRRQSTMPAWARSRTAVLRLERWPARSHAAALRDLAAELGG